MKNGIPVRSSDEGGDLRSQTVLGLCPQQSGGYQDTSALRILKTSMIENLDTGAIEGTHS